MIRLVHLSDSHLTAPGLAWGRSDWFNKRMAAWINFRYLGRRFRFRHAEVVLAGLMAQLRERRPDGILFSGDATALGFESELRHAAELLGVGEFPGLAVPGNHDYCTPAAAASGLFERCFAPWQEGQRIDGAPYPFARPMGDGWLIGVNSCTGNIWPWDAAGSVGAEQRARLHQLLSQLPAGPRLLVTHYPVCLASGKSERRTHGLRDLEATVAVAAQDGVCLWLHGHRHDAYCLPRPSQAPFPVICAGSATQSGMCSYWEYTLEGRHLHAQRRVFNQETNGFENGPAFDLELGGCASGDKGS